MTDRSSRWLPLCVDLDGTLTPVDTLHESLLGLSRHSVSALLEVPARLGTGKAAFKAWVAARAPVDVEALPFNAPLLEWLRTEKAGGRRLVLATASDRATAEAVAAHLGLFDEVIASDGASNLSGEAKRAALVARFGEKGFDYVGNDAPDLAVWRSAAGAVVVGGAPLARRAGEQAPVLVRFDGPRTSVMTWVRALRLHQWVKNVLVLVPALLAHELGDPAVLLAALAAFLAFGLCASSVYVFNDLLDLAADRRHVRKRHRPFAAGALSARQGVLAGALLLLAAAVVAVLINPWFCLVLGGYYLLTWAYSLALKRHALIDVMMLAGLYTLRIIAGSAATLILPSFWLLGFSVFLFLSLGIVKRYAELDDARRAGRVVVQGRGYTPDDLPLLQGLGVASGYSAIVVLALYVNNAASARMYSHAEVLWLLCPIMLFWISRVWLYASRGQMHDDPIVFALRDRVSLVLGLLMGLAVLAAV